MAVPAATRLKIQHEMLDWLRAGGGDVESFRARFPDIPRSTFFRWLSAARMQTGREEAKQVLKTAEELRQEAADVMPIPVGIDSLMPLTGMNALQFVQEAIIMAKRAAAYCENDGRIRNLKGYQQAARTLLASVDTLCRVAERIQDHQRVEQFHSAIIRAIEDESPETARRIVERVRKVYDVWAP